MCEAPRFAVGMRAVQADETETRAGGRRGWLDGSRRPLAGVKKDAWAAAIGALAVGVLLRVPYLGSMPTPAHDEGNWGLIAWRIYLGRGADMPADARFVSPLFAHLEALAYRVHGHPSFAAGRAVLVVGLLLGALVAMVQCARARMYRAGAVVVAALCVHPWCVLFTRVTPAPYPLSLVLGVCTSLFALRVFGDAGPRTKARAWVETIALGQLFSLGFHFSPLAVLPGLAAGLWALGSRERRGRALSWPTLASVLLAGAHVLPIAREALVVAARGNTRPSDPFGFFRYKLENYVRVCVGGLTGESTVRDFTNAALGSAGEWAASIAAVAVVAYALAPVREGEIAQEKSSEVRARVRGLVSLARCNMAVALVGMPLMLLPARQWHLGAVDAERYLFALLIPAVLALGALAERGVRGRVVAWAACAYLLAVPTARSARFFLYGGGPDYGLPVQSGGGAGRRWKVTTEREALPVLMRREAERASREAGARAVFVINDYTLHPLYFANVGDGYEVLQPRGDGTLAPRPGMLHVFVRWSEGVFAPGFDPQYMVRDNERLAELMRGPGFEPARLLKRYTQPNGAPLLELWAARALPATAR